ncbi:porin family protein [Pseudofulvibacter geojedonensis]|uniref:Porin family protein n=1 Tax=Pseudofulvibacter geojedonensis TaxID=1123758 RepID=A0ABW3I6J0_9FLAO
MLLKTFLKTILLFSSLFSFSQNDSFLGIQAGPNLSFIRGNIEANSNNGGVAFSFGSSYELFLKDNFSLIANINYSKNNVRRSFSSIGWLDLTDPTFGNGKKVVIKNNFKYLDLILLSRIYLGNGNKFFINTGGFLSKFINHTEIADGHTNRTDTNRYFRDFNTGITLGFGTNFQLKNLNKISLELRANHGFTNISKIQMIDDGKLKISSLNLIINYSFKLNKNTEGSTK